MLVVNLVLIGLVTMAVVMLLSERNFIKKSLETKSQQIVNLTNMILDQNKITSRLSIEVSNNIKSSSKLLNIIDKMNHSTKETIDNIGSDINGMMQTLKALIIQEQKSIDTHNELVNFTIDEIGKIWCDLVEEDCDLCPYKDECKSIGRESEFRSMLSQPPISTYSPDELGVPLSDKPFTDNCAGSMTIDPSDPSQIDSLLDRMKKSGMPDSVLEKYKAAIKQAVEQNPDHIDKVSIVWKSEPIDVPSSIDKRSEERERLIDPNSKIVKSLEELYKKSK